MAQKNMVTRPFTNQFGEFRWTISRAAPRLCMLPGSQQTHRTIAEQKMARADASGQLLTTP